MCLLLGMVTQLPQDYFEFLNKLQQRLTRVIKSVGKIEHSQWRRFSNDRKQVPMAVRRLAENVPVTLLY